MDEYEHAWTFVSQPAGGDPFAGAVREGKANMAMGDRFFRFARHADADGFTREGIVPSITIEGVVEASDLQRLNDDFVLLAARQLFKAALPALLEDATK